MPVLAIVAGPNGSGKTTLVSSGALDRVIAGRAGSINADNLARALAGDAQPTDGQSLLAAQMADTLLDTMIKSGKSVIVETVLSSDKYKARVLAARAAGYEILLVYVTVNTQEASIARVAYRFRTGGHNVPVERITARRERSHAMFVWFAHEADQVFVYDNSDVPVLAASKHQSRWLISDLSVLPPDLAASIEAMAAA